MSGDPKAMYSGMMRVRFFLIVIAYGFLYKGLTIAIRYSLLRKQFKDSQGKEIRIFDYQLQKQKLFSELVKAHAMSSMAHFLRVIIWENQARSMNGDFSLLQQTHLLLSCCKAMFTWWNTRAMLTLIQCCGGHGYSMYSGLPNIFMTSFPDTILEGENSVLILQVSRSLVKAYQRIKMGETEDFSEDLRYLLEMDELEEFELGGTEKDIRNFDDLVKTFQKVAAYHIGDTSLALYQKISEGMDPKAVRKRRIIKIKIWEIKSYFLFPFFQLFTNYSFRLGIILPARN